MIRPDYAPQFWESHSEKVERRLDLLCAWVCIITIVTMMHYLPRI